MGRERWEHPGFAEHVEIVVAQDREAGAEGEEELGADVGAGELGGLSEASAELGGGKEAAEVEAAEGARREDERAIAGERSFIAERKAEHEAQLEEPRGALGWREECQRTAEARIAQDGLGKLGAVLGGEAFDAGAGLAEGDGDGEVDFGVVAEAERAGEGGGEGVVHDADGASIGIGGGDFDEDGLIREARREADAQGKWWQWSAGVEAEKWGAAGSEPEGVRVNARGEAAGGSAVIGRGGLGGEERGEEGGDEDKAAARERQGTSFPRQSGAWGARSEHRGFGAAP